MTPPHNPILALVIGGSRGIGRSVTDRLVAEGCKTIATARNHWQFQPDGPVSGEAGSCLAFQADVNDPKAMENLIAFIDETWGHLDILVNNAGGVPMSGPFDELGDYSWKCALELNLISTARTTRLALPLLRRRGGSVVNIASFVAQTPGDWNPHYSAAKAALINLTQHLAHREAPNMVRFNAVSPGHIDTDGWRDGLTGRAERTGVPLEVTFRAEKERIAGLVPLRRLGVPSEIAAAVWFLASNQGSYVTGVNLQVDGGRTL